MSEPITQKELAEGWLKIAIETLKKALDNEKVSRDRLILFESFLGDVIGSGASVQEIVLKFNYYLRYLDMGVGRGVPAGSRAAKADFLKFRNSKGQLHQYGRAKKAVYNKPMTHQIKRLQELLLENFGIKAIQAIDNALTKNNVEIKL